MLNIYLFLDMSNKTIIQFRNQKQFVITLPKGLVLAKSWKKGDNLEFVLDKTGNILIKKVIGKKVSNKSILQFPNNKQFTLTIPKDLVLAKGWKKGYILEFIFDDKSNLIMKKVIKTSKLRGKGK